MMESHGFRVEEAGLLDLHRRVGRTQARMFIYLLMALILLMVSVVLAPRWMEAAWLLLVALVLLVAFARCLRKLPAMKEEERELTQRQREIYLVLKRREWREAHNSLVTPDWQVLDYWNENKHLYALMDPDGIGEEWENPLEQSPKVVHPRRRKKS